MDNPAWTTNALDEARRTGDTEVDPLAQGILTGNAGTALPSQLGYLQLMDLANVLLEAPELGLAPGSQVRRELDALPGLGSYFNPQPVPAWVDAGQLAIASRVWDENKLVIIGVLYAASLPSCYLIAKGIPALYDSGKLRDPRFINQRIYETGLMLEAVMEPGGINVVNDALPTGGTVPQRWMWGRGVIAARKVRMLHAAMRYLLVNPPPAPPPPAAGETATVDALAQVPVPAQAPAPAAGTPAAHQRLTVVDPYDVDKLGQPVNQEDLAYTLLTFGYLIPLGLERWGCRLSAEEKEAFLHTWRLVAHLMGVQEQLVPRSWQEAAALFAIIHQRQCGGSPMGQELTGTLNGFLSAYLPAGLRQQLPSMLIVSQLGKDDAQLILPHGLPRPGPLLRTGFTLGLAGLHAYFFITDRLVHVIPVIGTLLDSTFRRAGEALVDSWRDDYQRLPFALPASAAAPWQSQPGVDAQTRVRLRRWRARLFTVMCSGLGCLMAATLIGGALALAAVLRGFGLLGEQAWNPLPYLLGVMAIYLVGVTILQLYVAAEVTQRPGPPPPGVVSSSTRVAARRLRKQR